VKHDIQTALRRDVRGFCVTYTDTRLLSEMICQPLDSLALSRLNPSAPRGLIFFGAFTTLEAVSEMGNPKGHILSSFRIIAQYIDPCQTDKFHECWFCHACSGYVQLRFRLRSGLYRLYLQLRLTSIISPLFSITFPLSCGMMASTKQQSKEATT